MDKLLHQNPVQLQGDVFLLAVSNKLTLLGSQTNHFLAKTKTKKGNEGFRCSSWPITLAFQLETTMKRSSPNVNVTPTTTSTMMSRTFLGGHHVS